MSARTIELFRQYSEKEPLKHEPEHTPKKAQERSEQPKKPNLAARNHHRPR
jgi:hypothetical protein